MLNGVLPSIRTDKPLIFLPWIPLEKEGAKTEDGHPTLVPRPPPPHPSKPAPLPELEQASLCGDWQSTYAPGWNLLALL